MKRVQRRLAKGVGLLLVLCTSTDAADLLPDSVDRNGDGEIVIACLGDSNTASGWQFSKDGGFPSELGWCEQLGRQIGDPRVRVVNLGLGGATMSPNLGMPKIGLFFSGLDQLDYALTTNLPDVVMMAFGTNDIVMKNGPSLEEIVDYHYRAWRRVRSHDLVGLVATIPPVYANPQSGRIPRPRQAIATMNELLREAFPDRVLMDFRKDMRRADYMDLLHMDADGQATRAREAQRALRASAATTPPPAGIRALRWEKGHWRPKTRADLGERIGLGD